MSNNNGVITHEVGRLYAQSTGTKSETVTYGNINITILANYWDDSDKYPDGALEVTAEFTLPSDMCEDEDNFRECLQFGNIAYRALKEQGYDFHHMIEEGVAVFAKDASEYEPQALGQVSRNP